MQPVEKAYTIATAAAKDLNDELTIILCSVDKSFTHLDPGHPARPLLMDIQAAAQRSAWKTSSLQNYSARHGAQAVAARMEKLFDAPF